MPPIYQFIPDTLACEVILAITDTLIVHFYLLYTATVCKHVSKLNKYFE